MGQTNIRFGQILGLILLAALLSACGSSTTGTGVSTVSGSARLRNITPTEYNTGCDFFCVSLTAASESAFSQAILGLLDASDFGQVGQVAMSGGASIGLRVGFSHMSDATTETVMPDATQLQIVIRDKINGQPQPPIQITLDGATGGIANGGVDVDGVLVGSNLQVEFSDPYGTIVVAGQINGQNLDGTVSYLNNYSVKTGKSPGQSSNNVLRFQIPWCQVVSCAQ